jgi:fructose-1,6-bisphosphatase
MMKLSELIEIRDALVATKLALHELSIDEIHIAGGLYDKLKPVVDKTYGPIAKMNILIEQMTNIEVKVTND